ncbi:MULTISPECIES: hypothetical protein [unclassified Sphingomonas]|uniref:hypothetical protein n=1 Tax=unclassified Sphingomonas TaxID=196159 RepID=UPI0012E0FB56|nr:MULTISPECIES: hypothetical protein [unclassified Sphingomonas]
MFPIARKCRPTLGFDGKTQVDGSGLCPAMVKGGSSISGNMLLLAGNKAAAAGMSYTISCADYGKAARYFRTVVVTSKSRY